MDDTILTRKDRTLDNHTRHSNKTRRRAHSTKKKNEQAVNSAPKTSDDQYRAIIENIEDGYYEVDLEGNFTFFNDSMARMVGYTRDELIGMNNRKIMDQFTAKQVFDVFHHVYKTGLPAKAFDWVLVCKDKSCRIIEVSVSLKKDLDGNPIGFMGIARDITQRKLIEKTLRESEEKYRTIIENIEDGYYEVDIGGNFTFFNNSLTRIVGYTRDELMGMNNRKIVDPFTAKQVYDVFNLVYKTGLPTKAFDWELISKDSKRHIIEVSVTLKKDLSGKPVGFMGIARDITPRREYEKKLQRREKELEEKTRSLKETNTALKVLLDRRDKDKFELEESIRSNINTMVIPYLNQLSAISKENGEKKLLSVIESNIKNITSRFTVDRGLQSLNLTSAQLEVANYIKNGKSSKEIADLLNVSCRTVEVHRANIRKKIGIKNKKADLRTCLKSIHCD